MRILGNILWFIFGGLELGLLFISEGLVCMISLIGIPFGLQWFKMVPLVFVPFGKGIRYPKVTGAKVFGNVMWAIFVGWWNGIICFLVGLVCFITIIGIPFGKQWWKLARLMICPFGAEVYNEVAEKKQEKKERKREEKLVREAAAAAVAAAQNAGQTVGNAPSASMAATPAGTTCSPSGTWICPKCGASGLEEDTLFCDNCGTPKPHTTVGNTDNADDFRDKAADLGKKTAETAAAVGAKVSDVTTNTVVPFFKEKFIPAVKKFGSWVKKQFIRFGFFLRTHKEQIIKAMPAVGSVVIGIAAVILIVTFSVNASEKGKIIGAYNAEKHTHDEAVKEVQTKIDDYVNQAEELNASASEMERQITQKNEEDRTIGGDIAALAAEVSQKENLQSELNESVSVFKDIDNGYNTAQYAEKQLSELIVSQQQRIYDLKSEVAKHIDSLYSYLSDDWDGSDFSFAVAEPVDISSELAKEIINSVAGEFDSEIADIAAGVVTDVMDGTDLASSIGSQLQSAVQDKISDITVNALDSVMGGMYSKFSDVADVVGTFESVYNRLSDTTPGYCVNHLYHEMEQCVYEMSAFIDNDSVDSKDIASLMNTVNKLCLLEYSCNDILGELRADYAGGLILSDSVQKAYTAINTDNEQMAYLFSLMEG